MINNEELRLGNLVQDIVSGEWMRIDAIGDNLSAVIIDRAKFPLPANWEMGPIKLTPEILEKVFGFVSSGPYLLRGNTYVWEFIWFGGDRRYFLRNLHPEDERNNPIEYVHDLQNLYFLENGKQELPVNLEYAIKRTEKTDF